MDDAGKFTSRMTLQNLSSTQDAVGQPVQTWTDVATVWAWIKNNSGVESIKADAEMSVVKASVRLRTYRSDVTTRMRLVLGTTVYNIRGVLPDPNREFVDLTCEVVA